MTLPAWLVERLRDENPDGVTRRARLGTCERCGHPVLRGLDDDVCGWVAVAAPIEVDRFGEYLALARGLRTYHLARRFSVTGGSRWELDTRTRWAIESTQLRYAVVPQHGCGIWLPSITDGILANTWKPATAHNGPPPF